MCETPILALPDFLTPNVECDASGVWIGAILVEKKIHIFYFSEKSGWVKLNAKEFMQLCKHLIIGHFLRPNHFILHLDHEAMNYLRDFVEGSPYDGPFGINKTLVIL